MLRESEESERDEETNMTPRAVTHFVSLLASFANSWGVFFFDQGKLKSDDIIPL